MKGFEFIWFVLYLAIGSYLLNITLGFFVLSEGISAFDNWIIFAGGLLCIFGGINHFRLANIKRRTRRVAKF